jgi:hypothetical protein
MLPLAGSALPTSSQTLAEAVRTGLAAHGIAAAEVAARGDWPALDTFAIDLTGASLATKPSFPRQAAEIADRFSVREFSLRAAPAQIRDVPVTLDLTGHQATFSLARADAEGSLRLSGATEGHVAVQITREALEQLVHQLASDAAKQHGVQIKQTRLTVTSRGPRAVSIAAEVTAKAFIATATVTISGDADVDENFVARLSNLRFGGEGMIANLAAGAIRPTLAALEGRTFPLLSLAGDALRLRDVQVEVGETIRLAAQFGG